MKKSAYSSCTDTKSSIYVSKNDYIFDDGNSYDAINPCDDPEIFTDYNNLPKVHALNKITITNSHASKNDTYVYRGDFLIKCDVVDKGNKYREPKYISFLGNSTRYVSNYSLHYLQNTYYLSPCIPKVLNKINPNKDVKESEAFGLIESREDVIKKQKDEEIDEIIRKHNLRY